MSYKNGRELLPEELLSEIQKYIQGELIYIPREENERKAWGQNNGTREFLSKRNLEIFNLYKSGDSMDKLIKMYNLSEDSIRKIIKNIVKQKTKNISKDNV